MHSPEWSLKPEACSIAWILSLLGLTLRQELEDLRIRAATNNLLCELVDLLWPHVLGFGGLAPNLRNLLSLGWSDLSVHLGGICCKFRRVQSGWEGKKEVQANDGAMLEDVRSARVPKRMAPFTIA